MALMAPAQVAGAVGAADVGDRGLEAGRAEVGAAIGEGRELAEVEVAAASVAVERGSGQRAHRAGAEGEAGDVVVGEERDRVRERAEVRAAAPAGCSR